MSLNTARLPDKWQSRLIVIDNPNTNGYVGLCLETHDLLISKYFAGREKDLEFCAAVVQAGLVNRQESLARLDATEVDATTRERMQGRIAADFLRFRLPKT